MSINLPPSVPATATRQLLQGLQSGRNSALQAMVRALDLQVGDTLSAQVQRIRPLSDQQRQALQQALQQQALGTELKSLLQSPRLQLVELTARGQPLLTFSDQALRPRQTLQLQLAGAARLVLLAPSGSGDGAAANRRELIGQSLRALLPQQYLQQHLQQHPQKQPLQQLLQTLDVLAKSAAGPALPPPVRQALDLLQRHVHTPAALSQPRQLSRILSQMGLFYENRLNRAVSQAGEIPRALPAGDLKGALLQAVRRLEAALATARTPAAAPGPASPFVRLSQAAAAGQSPASLNQPLHQPLHQSLPALLRLWQQPGDRPQGDSGRGNLRVELMSLLQQQLLASLAKLQLRQLQSLPPSANPQEQGTQTWQVEIPLRFAGAVHSMEMHIEQKWEKPDSRRSDDPRKVRQWFVALAFDIPGRGAIYAHLKIIDATLAASIWAQRQETLHAAQQKLQQLRANLQDSGLEVSDIRCFKGQPPGKDVRLDYSLIDIRT